MQPGCEKYTAKRFASGSGSSSSTLDATPMGPRSVSGPLSALSMNRAHAVVDGCEGARSDPPGRGHARQPPAGVDAPGVQEEEK